jgi:poly(A) polymerase
MTSREFALQIVQRLQQAGYIAYWAGGCVRDQLLGLDPKDYDVATNAQPYEIAALFPRRNEIGVAFGVVQVIGPRGPDGQWLTVEVATFRSDLGYSDGRRPDAVAFSSPREDALRRDFTINGMFYDPIRGELIDYVGGQADLQARLLRAIGQPNQRFAEDKLRLLRAVRLAARYQLTIEPQTASAARNMAEQIGVVAPERIAEELRKMLSHKSRGRAVRLLRELGLIPPILPELVPTFDQPHRLSLATIPAHSAETLWDHTVRVVESLPEEASFPLALAALLHDIGVVAPTATISQEASADPPAVAAELAAGIAWRLRLSNAEKDRLVWLIRHQAALFEAPQQKPHHWRPLLAEPAAGELIALHRAEALACGGFRLEAVEMCAHWLREWPPEKLNPPPLLRGSDLLALGIPAGPQIKWLLELVRQAQWDDQIQTKEQALAWVQQQWHQVTIDPTKCGWSSSAVANPTSAAPNAAAITPSKNSIK